MSKNSNNLSRRGFLKAVGLGGAAMLAAGPEPAEAAGPDEELCTLLDLSKCVGCGLCVEACRETNAHKFPEPKKPFPKMHPARVKVEDWSDKRDVDDRLTPYNWLYIQSAVVEHEGREVEVNIPRRCLHCHNPPCANLCPWGAAGKEANGVVRINDEICLGGAKCRKVCPWHIPQRQTGVGLYLDILPGLAGNGVMYKCDRCFDRLAQGKLPACIEVCPENVQSIGPRSEIAAKARDLAREMNGYLYGDVENGGTNTIYVSPVPFEKLNRAVEKGQGRPHLRKVPNMMAKEENLAWAVFAAPFAGLAAGALSLGAGLKNKKSGQEKEGGDE